MNLPDTSLLLYSNLKKSSFGIKQISVSSNVIATVPVSGALLFLIDRRRSGICQLVGRAAADGRCLWSLVRPGGRAVGLGICRQVHCRGKAVAGAAAGDLADRAESGALVGDGWQSGLGNPSWRLCRRLDFRVSDRPAVASD